MYKLFSHRGNTGSLIKEENSMDNSLEGIINASKRPYIDGYEFDFRLTKDNVLVAVHDKNIKHISKGRSNKDISDMTLEELQSYKMHDIKYYYRVLRLRAAFLLPDKKRLLSIINAKLKSEAIIPTAEELFDYLVKNNIKKEIIAELKASTKECADTLIILINKYKNKLNICVHGYDVDLMIHIKNETGVKTGLLVKHLQHYRLKEEFINSHPFDFYSLLWCYFTTKDLYMLIKNNKGINFWTIDSKIHLNRIKRIINKLSKRYGVVLDNYGIITNIPDLIYEYDKKGEES
jgi:glycerophosphoryl diester phosphodiesterase